MTADSARAARAPRASVRAFPLENAAEWAYNGGVLGLFCLEDLPMKKGLGLLLVLAAIGGGAWWYFSRPQEQVVQVAYKTAELTRGQVTQTIRATGTIEPEDLIDIGAQITGQIMAFGVDTQGREVDYCSEVKKGQLLARIDDVTYKAEVTIAKANLTTAQAQLAGAKADVVQFGELLFTPDDEQALANRVMRLYSDATERQRLGELCKERAQQYDINNMVDSYIDFYNKLLRKKTKQE